MVEHPILIESAAGRDRQGRPPLPPAGSRARNPLDPDKLLKPAHIPSDESARSASAACKAMPPGSSRWPTAAMPRICSGSSPARGRSFPLDKFHLSRSLRRTLRSGQFTVTMDRDFPAVIAACADREETWINAEIERAMLALHCVRPRPFDRSLARRRAGWRPLRREARPGLFRRKHVQPDDRRVESRAGLARRAAEGRRLHSARLPVHDRHLASLGAVSVLAKGLCRVAVGGARRRSAAGSGQRGGFRSQATAPAGRSAAGASRPSARTCSRSTGCSRRPGAAGSPAAAGYVIAQLLGQTS